MATRSTGWRVQGTPDAASGKRFVHHHTSRLRGRASRALDRAIEAKVRQAARREVQEALRTQD
jgi:hypothetical protein